MSSIPTWPVLRTVWGAAYNANGGVLPTYTVDLSNRILSSHAAKRGKQYELDTAQAGELTTTLRNDDAVLDPTNASGPFAGYIAPYQPVQIQAQYPATANLLTSFQATCGGGYSTGTIPTGMGIASATDGTGGSVQTITDAYEGNTVFQFANTTSTASRIFYINNCPVQPGQTYTLQMRVRCVTAGVTAPVCALIKFYGANVTSGGASILTAVGSTVTLTGATPPGTPWTYITVSGTAPAASAGLVVGLQQAGAASANNSIQVDVIQWEASSTASAWTAPGFWYDLFTGYIERWPSKWNSAGMYGTISATVTDAMALLSQGQLSDPLTEEINQAGATWTYKLNDPDGADLAAEANGKYPPLIVVSSSSGPGTLTFGNSITATDTVNGVFTAGGTGGSVVSVTPSVAGNTNVAPYPQASFLSLDQSGIKGPANPASWSRMIAWRYTGPTPTSGNEFTLWSSFDSRSTATQMVNGLTIGLNALSGTTGGCQIMWALNNGLGGYNWSSSLYGPGGFGTWNPFDGNWHVVLIGYNDSTLKLNTCVDGVTFTYSISSGSRFPQIPAIVRDSLGGWCGADYSGWQQFQGDIAYAAEFPTMLTTTQMTNIYSAWSNACTGDTPTQRYARILRYANYAGPVNLGNGVLTTSMGPATDLDGSDALSCLNNVVTTENGNHYVSNSGVLTFTGRAFRYNQPTPSYIFGENVTAGEWPYEDLELDFDTTHLANDVTVTQNFSSQNFYAINTASQQEYFDRTMSRTLNDNSAQDCQAAASFLAWRYGAPLTRVDKLVLNPAGQPSLWPICLALDLGMCVQVNRRPPGCPEISLLMWIEQMSWDIDDKGNAKLTLQCSPAIPTNQAQFSVWSSTLKNSVSAGANSVTINPCADATNSLAAQLGSGLSVIVDPGGTNPEVMTVLLSSSTGGPPWISGAITFTANLAHNHAANAVIQEYSANAPNPTAYESESVFDSVLFTY